MIEFFFCFEEVFFVVVFGWCCGFELVSVECVVVFFVVCDCNCWIVFGVDFLFVFGVEYDWKCFGFFVDEGCDVVDVGYVVVVCGVVW